MRLFKGRAGAQATRAHRGRVFHGFFPVVLESPGSRCATSVETVEADPEPRQKELSVVQGLQKQLERTRENPPPMGAGGLRSSLPLNRRIPASPSEIALAWPESGIPLGCRREPIDRGGGKTG